MVRHSVVFKLAKQQFRQKVPQQHVYSSPVTFAGLLVGHEVESNLV
jgi:hypothetical protein